MIYLTWVVDDINIVMQAYHQIQIERGSAESGPFATVSGLGPITLVSNQSTYTDIDEYGTSTNWYRSRYYNTSNSLYSAWSDPILGEAGIIYHNPLYPPEVSYGTSQQLVIERIRRLIGDPVGLRREAGEEATSSIHFDNKTYELAEKGWPADIHMGTVSMNETLDPTVNGYRYLKFDENISTTTWSGCVEYGVDIWYYTFRWSDREIMEAYDNCPPPAGLTTTTANSEAYMLQTSIDLLYSELWLDSGEDGAAITDEGSRYDPSPGLNTRRALIDDLQKRLDKLTQSLILSGVTGVLID